MLRLTLAAAAVLTACGPAAAQSDSRREKLNKLTSEFRSGRSKLVRQINSTTDAKKRNALIQKYLAPPKQVKEALKLAKAKPTDAVALDAAVFVVQSAGRDAASAKAAQRLLLKHHKDSPKLVALLPALSRNGESAVDMIKKIRGNLKGDDAKAEATYHLAQAYVNAAKSADGVEETVKLNKMAADLFESVADKLKNPRNARNAKGLVYELRNLSVGNKAPEIEGKTLDGKTEKLSDYRGKVVVIDVWATWCPPCRAMIPHENEMVKRLKGKPFELISVSADQKQKTLEDFLKKTKMPWKHWWDGERKGLVSKWKIRYYPTIYVIDHKGVIRYRDVRGKAMDEAVDTLLKEMGTDTAKP